MMKYPSQLNSRDHYDYLIVGTGLYGSTFARIAAEKVLIDRREHVGGNAYTEMIEGIHVHRYGAHVFHTNDEEVWRFLQRFASFNDYIHTPKANYKGESYTLPFNMHTFHEMWGVTEPEEAKAKIEEQRRAAGITDPKNLEEQAIFLVGTDIYEKLIKGYTQKQWGRDCRDLPAFIIRRLPMRLNHDCSYCNAKYQGVPVGGYTAMVESILNHENIHVLLGQDYLKDRDRWNAMADRVVFTGPIDAFYDHTFGYLEYRSAQFEIEELDIPDFQGNAVINYTDADTPWTRITEHKWFQFGKDEEGNDLSKTVITREYCTEWAPGDEPYYPINDEKNTRLYRRYRDLADREEKVTFGGRLGEYTYYDMDQVVAAAMKKADELLK